MTIEQWILVNQEQISAVAQAAANAAIGLDAVPVVVLVPRIPAEPSGITIDEFGNLTIGLPTARMGAFAPNLN